MNLPQEVFDAIVALHARHPDLSNGNDDQRRQLTRMMAEQSAFIMGLAWGTKAQSPTHPQSKDQIAHRISPTEFDVWDWQNGTTREVQVHPNSPPNERVTGQFFIAVSPINHLGSTPIPTPPPDDKLDHIIENQMAITQSQTAIIRALDNLAGEVNALVDRPHPPAPIYEGRIFGFGITLTPRK